MTDDLNSLPIPQWAVDEGWTPEEWAEFMEACESDYAHVMKPWDGWPGELDELDSEVN